MLDEPSQVPYDIGEVLLKARPRRVVHPRANPLHASTPASAIALAPSVGSSLLDLVP